MVTYKEHVQEPHFSNIKSGRKTIEGRLYNGNFAKMNVNDTAIWFCGDKTVLSVIKRTAKYSSFKEMIEAEKLENALPGTDTVEQGEKIYYGFYTGWSRIVAGFLCYLSNQ